VNFENLDVQPADYLHDLTRESVVFAEGHLIHSQAVAVETDDLGSRRILFAGMSCYAEAVDTEALLAAAHATAGWGLDRV
jgi:hypothetical protein